MEISYKEKEEFRKNILDIIDGEELEESEVFRYKKGEDKFYFEATDHIYCVFILKQDETMEEITCTNPKNVYNRLKGYLKQLTR